MLFRSGRVDIGACYVAWERFQGVCSGWLMEEEGVVIAGEKA